MGGKPPIFIFMEDIYNKIIAGYEFCILNIDCEMTLEQFAGVKQLCDNYVNLCEYYLSTITNKYGYKYLNEVIQEKINHLNELMTTWFEIYEEKEGELNDRYKKQMDIAIQFDMQDKYFEEKIKNRIQVKGFIG
jgi:hypothetical protein